ncbi:hypothetical protein Back11_57990 [Paenibacillus baekrokdamisoli]|uniref:Uncharacterized protein n=1 Tax=Paenibacillus baekrokdamisoli TaxID=1712516 RepID=A0A3G9JNL6_9BACL|nr:hypothetical protein [Paenibacillus baekrokdamisoli]MBB3072896.1 hypothetical protein [Paenibacillus baekrokdamisoli]BBH24454.1 hypothetical protein Back11_57990 [Paenibacillus baekrokdamisoli]
MSEFTSGNITLNDYRSVVEQSNPTFIKELNEKWLVFFTNETYVNNDYPTDIIDLTNQIPILYFYNFEDHGWGYSVIFKSHVQASFYFSYELEHNALCDLTQERYPDEDPIEFLYMNSESDNLKAELLSSEEYKELLKKQFDNCNFECLNLFNINEEQIRKLESKINYESLMENQNPHELVELYKDILNLNEMSWIRSDRIDNLED